MSKADTNKHKGPIAWMVNNPVAANLLMVVLLVGGLIFALSIQQEVFPEFTVDEVTVSISYPGASPEEVEQGITLAVEEAVQGLDGVKKVTSTSSEGRATVIVEALEGSDLQKLSQDVKSEVDRISSFPEEAEDPEISISSFKRSVLSLMVYGDQEQMVLRNIAENLRQELLNSPGITQVELSEVSGLQISIEVPQAKLREYNLTLNDIADRIENSAVDVPGGSLDTDSGEILVRMKERKDYGRDFARIPVVTGNDGTEVRLEDIGTIIDGFQDTDIITSYKGKSAVRVDVYRIGDQTPLSVSEATTKALDQFRISLPNGVNVDVLNDRSDIFMQRMDLLLSNGFMGLLLVFVLLGLFLESKLAFWVSMGIPTSFLGSFLILSYLGMSINMITMFAFLIALGIVVDDAIVVGENVYSLRERGVGPIKAAIEGAQSISMPVVFSVLTNIVAFMPLLFVPGTMGKMLRSIPVVVISVFSISLIESLFVLPAHLAHMKKASNGPIAGTIRKVREKADSMLMSFVHKTYRPFLDRCVSWRYATVACGLGLLILSGAYVAGGYLGTTLMPRVESDYAFATAELPYGSSSAKSEKVRDKLIAAAHRVADKNGGEKLMTGTFSKIGGEGRDLSGSHVTKVQVFLTDADTRPISTAEFTKLWRQEVGKMPELDFLSFESDRGGPGSGNSLEIQLSHSDVNTLESAATELADALTYFPNVKDVDDGFSSGKEQLDFTVTPAGKSLGLTAQSVAQQVRAAYYGAEVLRQQRGRNEVKVMVRRPESERSSEFDLEEMMIRTPDGVEVPLREVVNVKRGRAYTVIKHTNGRRTLVVGADVTPRDQTNRVLTEVMKTTIPQLKAKYPGLTNALEGHQQDMNEGATELIGGLLLSMLVIYALLAIPFKSYTQPVIIMVCIPFGIVGAVLGHAIMGYSISLTSLLGIVALAGVVVNDSLVFIDFANQQVAKGHCAHDAVLESGTTRFRPILLTTMTTFLGLAPMILETSRQARFLIPMALSLGFGILFATLITLVLVPSIYMILDDVHMATARLAARLGNRKTPSNHSV